MLGQVNACYFLKPGDRLMVIRAKRKRKVTVVKEYPYHILVDVGMYKESNGNKGIAAGLGNIQKVRDGEPLGSRMNAKDEFDAVDGEDDFLA